MTETTALESNLLRRLLGDHARLSWSEEAQEIIRTSELRMVELSQLAGVTKGFVLPSGVPFDPDAPVTLTECFGRNIPLLHSWNPADFPDFSPVEGHAWLWRNREGVLIPAFNLDGAIRFFFSFGDERATSHRDRHGRLPASSSLLQRHRLTQTPVVNLWFFAILSILEGLNQGGCGPQDPSRHILPPIVVLSHDCDQLRGNDIHTQLSRLARFARPALRARFPDFFQIWHILANVLHPRRYFFDDALRMIAAEKRYGFRSAFYFLAGRGGRLGARSGNAIIADLAAHIPYDFEVGIHYNYRDSEKTGALLAQKNLIETLSGRSVRSGRAHYLTLDPLRAFPNLREAGIMNDESIGFSTQIGLKLGYAGAFRIPLDGTIDSSVVEIPLLYMDTNLQRSNLNEQLDLALAVESVGGVVTMLFHPGSFQNPEMPSLHGVYESCLEHFSSRRYRCFLPGEIGADLRQDNSIDKFNGSDLRSVDRDHATLG